MSSDPRGSTLIGLLALTLILTLGLGVAKLFVQRAHPPAYLTGSTQLYDGFVSIDGHSLRAEKIRTWLDGGDPGARDLRIFLAGDLHPSALAVPVSVALLTPLVGSIPAAFATLSALALVLQVLLVMALVRAVADPERPASAAPWIAGILVAGHCLSARTAAQLLLDPFCALIATAATLLVLRRQRRPGAGSAAVLVLILTLGLFTKISCLPLLALPALAALLGEPAGRCARFARSASLCALLPLGLWFGYLLAVPGSPTWSREPSHLIESWNLDGRHLAHFAQESLLLFQVLPLFLLWRAGPWRAGERIVLLAGAILLFSTWAFKLPPVPRLYLPVLGMLACLCAPRIGRNLPGRWQLPGLAIWVAANLALAGMGLWTLAR